MGGGFVCLLWLHTLSAVQIWSTDSVESLLFQVVDKSEVRSLLAKRRMPETGSEAAGFFALV